jgi:ribonuclease-3
MSRLRAAVVNEATLAELATSLDLGPLIFFGPGEKASGGETKPSILADALEAIIGAAYLSDGPKATRALFKRLWGPRIDRLVLRSDNYADYKTRLQEITQRQGLGLPQYDLVKQSGPDNEKIFTMSLSIPGWPLFTASGRTKKAASQLAAKACLNALKVGKDAFLASQLQTPTAKPKARPGLTRPQTL